MAYVVILRNNLTLLSVSDNWIQNPVLDEKTIVFFSPELTDQQNFQMRPKYHYDKDVTNCYHARVLKRFSKYLFLFNKKLEENFVL